MEEKIKSRDEIISLVSSKKESLGIIGFTSGVFDLLHPGHVSYLEKAAACCDTLIVGVNSDSSVTRLKGPKRPIMDQTSRARVIAALSSSSYVFIFDEQNNNKNIELLRPDLYIKAGDYDESKLSSAPLVKSYGGSVKIIAMEKGFSTSSIVEKIKDLEGIPEHASIPKERGEKRPVIFLDRDGTINEEIEYLHEPSKVKILPGVINGLKKLKESGYSLIVVTNQPGIGLGYFTKEDFFRVNKEIFSRLSREGILIEKVYFSPYSKADNSSCRKPSTGLIERACEEMPIDLSKSFIIGDSSADIQLGKNAGIKTVLLETGKGGKDGLYKATPDIRAKTLEEAAESIALLLP